LIVFYTQGRHSLNDGHASQSPSPAGWLLERMSYAEVKKLTEQITNARNDVQVLRRILSPWERILHQFIQLCMGCNPESYDSIRMVLSTYGLQKLLQGVFREHWRVLKSKDKGDCLYMAISNALFGTLLYGKVLRVCQVLHMIENSDVLQSICSNGLEMPFENLLEQTKDSRVWGSDQNLYMFSVMLDRPIVLHVVEFTSTRFFNKLYCANTRMRSKTPIYIVQGGNHYEAMVPEHRGLPTVEFENCRIDFQRLEEGYEFVDRDIIWNDSDLARDAVGQQGLLQMWNDRHARQKEQVKKDQRKNAKQLEKVRLKQLEDERLLQLELEKINRKKTEAEQKKIEKERALAEKTRMEIETVAAKKRLSQAIEERKKEADKKWKQSKVRKVDKPGSKKLLDSSLPRGTVSTVLTFTLIAPVILLHKFLF